MHSFCQTRLLTFLDPFCSIVVGEERRERERGTHPRGRKGGARCCLFCSVYSLCLRVNPDAQPQQSRVVGGTDNTSVCDFLILLQLPSLRDLFRFSPFFSGKQLPATVLWFFSLFLSSFFFWLFVLVLLLSRRLICIACLRSFFSFFPHVLVFHLFWCDSSASSCSSCGFFCVSVFEAWNERWVSVVLVVFLVILDIRTPVCCEHCVQVLDSAVGVKLSC